jgi:hypothetical protein
MNFKTVSLMMIMINGNSAGARSDIPPIKFINHSLVSIIRTNPSLISGNRVISPDRSSLLGFYVEFSDGILCDTCHEENIIHQFFECSCSQSFWWALGFEWNTNLNINDLIAEARTRYALPFLMEIIIAGGWSIWDRRNDAIFNGDVPNLTRCLCKFKGFIQTNMHQAKPSLKEGMQSWLDTL